MDDNDILHFKSQQPRLIGEDTNNPMVLGGMAPGAFGGNDIQMPQ